MRGPAHGQGTTGEGVEGDTMGGLTPRNAGARIDVCTRSDCRREA